MKSTPTLDNVLQALAEKPVLLDGLRDETLFLFYLLERSFDKLVDGLPKAPWPGKRECLKDLRSEAREILTAGGQQQWAPLAREAWNRFSGLLDRWQEAISRELAAMAQAGGEILKSTAETYRNLPEDPSQEKVKTAIESTKWTFRAADSAVRAKDSVENIRDGFLDAAAQALADIRGMAEGAADELGWTQEETPFEQPLDVLLRLSAARRAEDNRVLTPHWRRMADRQRRNPFAISDACRTREPINDYESGLQALRQRVFAALVVPRPSAFDRHRSTAVFDCIVAAHQACREHPAGKFYAPPMPPIAAAASTLAQLWTADNQFVQDPNDQVAFARMDLLGYQGLQRQALDVANTIRERWLYNGPYAYNVACLAATNGDAASALEWLGWLIRRLGYSKILDVRDDPDFDILRREARPSFDELTTVRCRVGINERTWSESVVLKNESAFRLTNVELQSLGPRRNGVRAPIKLLWNSVGPGETVEYPTPTFVTPRYTAVTYTVKCDQGTAGTADAFLIAGAGS